MGFHLSPPIFLGLLFVCLISIAVPALFLLQNTQTETRGTSESIEIPQLLSNCALYYQLCPTSNKGIAQQQTVSQILTETSSPLAQVGPLLHPQLDQPTSIETTPDQIVTLIATKKNLNPFLLLTLSEQTDHTVTKAENIDRKVENGGDKSAWFSLQHQLMANELLQIAQDLHLDPAATDEKFQKKSVKIGGQEVAVSGDVSLASGVVVEYLAAHSTSKEEFQKKVADFVPTYQQLFGLDPSTAVRE